MNLGQFTSGLGYQSEVEGLLDMVSRGCVRLMRSGGGPLRQAPSVQPVTTEEEQRFLALARQGLTGSAIAEQCGRSQTTVDLVLRRLGHEGRRQRFARLNTEAVRMVSRGVSACEIGRRLGMRERNACALVRRIRGEQAQQRKAA